RVRRPAAVQAFPGLSEGPLLVALAVAGPQFDGGAVGGGRSGHVEAQAGLDAGDGAVGVDVPLLVGAAAAGPDIDLGAGAGPVVEGIQALGAAVDGELAGGPGPGLVGAAVAGPDLGGGAVGLGGAGDVQALARSNPVDGTGEAAATASSVAGRAG